MSRPSPSGSLPPSESSATTASLPRGGSFRRIVGGLLTILGLFIASLGVAQSTVETILSGIVIGLVGGGLYYAGRRARDRRRGELMTLLQRQVLRLAARRGGTLTVTDVASELDVSLKGAERILFAMDDGFRVRSDVTGEGLLVYEFPEIRHRSAREFDDT